MSRVVRAHRLVVTTVAVVLVALGTGAVMLASAGAVSSSTNPSATDGVLGPGRVTVRIDEVDFPQVREVDRKLIELARATGGKIVTNDYNLNRVAELSGVAVLNINELANALKPVVLPGEPLHVQQRKQIEAYRAAWTEAGHVREPRVSVSRSIFALMDDRDRAYFGGEGRGQDQVGYIDANTRAIFGRSYAAEPDVLVKQLSQDEAIAAADTLLLTVPNQLGVEYNAHVIDSILRFVAPELGWR